MGFFTDDEVAGISIRRMSLHIVGGGSPFLPQDELDLEQSDFLLVLLKRLASDPVYQFDDVSSVRAIIEEISTERRPFGQGASALAQLFDQLHTVQTSEGAFLVFELATHRDDTLIYALIKYDYRTALEVEHQNGGTSLRRVVEALVDDRTAVQKSAIIRTVNGTAQPDISTQDRSAKQPNLTDFFQRYISASRTRSDAELTKSARTVVLDALRASRSEYASPLPTATAAANRVLRAAEIITEEVIRHAVWVGAGQPDDPTVVNVLNRNTDRQIAKHRLAGCGFNPDRTTLPAWQKKRITTQEGVVIEFRDDLEGRLVTVVPDGARTIIRIETNHRLEQDVIPDRAGRAT